MAGKIFSEDYKITNFEVNLHGNLTLQYILDLIVQASEDQSKVLKVGTKEVQKKGVTWVVIQYDADIKRMPRVDEKVKLQTQGVSYTKYFASRKFWIRDINNNPLITIDSLWVMMNLTTRKMVKIDFSAVEPFGSEKVKRIPRLTKIEKLTAGRKLTKEFPVCFSDIDFNGHVSNTKYLNWMSNTLDFAFLKSHVATSFSIKFADEVRYGDNVSSEAQQVVTDDKQIMTIHQIVVDDKIKATAQVTWKEIE